MKISTARTVAGRESRYDYLTVKRILSILPVLLPVLIGTSFVAAVLVCAVQSKAAGTTKSEPQDVTIALVNGKPCYCFERGNFMPTECRTGVGEMPAFGWCIWFERGNYGKENDLRIVRYSGELAANEAYERLLKLRDCAR